MGKYIRSPGDQVNRDLGPAVASKDLLKEYKKEGQWPQRPRQPAKESSGQQTATHSQRELYMGGPQFVTDEQVRMSTAMNFTNNKISS